MMRVGQTYRDQFGGAWRIERRLPVESARSFITFRALMQLGHPSWGYAADTMIVVTRDGLQTGSHLAPDHQRGPVFLRLA